MIGRSLRMLRRVPIVPAYGVNDQGSGDMYPKGGIMLHTIRQIVDDDDKWRAILRGLNRTFWHQTGMGKQGEDYISAHAGTDLTQGFDQRSEERRVGEEGRSRWSPDPLKK